MTSSGRFSSPLALAGLGLLFALYPALPAAGHEPVNIGSRRQLLVDHYLIANLDGLELRLHPPCPKEIVLIRGEPWEGSGSDFERLIQDAGIIRLYYMGTELTSADGTEMAKQPVVACYAESLDGIHWVKPDLGLFACNGSKHNNIIWMGPKLDNFTPFKDSNPDCPPSERYKATSAGGLRGLFAFKSADGVHWSHISDRPIITQGTFDTQNDAFWDPVRKHYWCYIRGFHDQSGNLFANTASGTRDIRVSTSKDFRTWTEPRLLKFVDSPDEALYTSQIEPYYRAPELLVGFPTRYVDRKVFSPAAMQALPDPAHRQGRMKFNSRFGTTVTDGQFMTSRDGYTFHRWDEAFIRPGPERRDNWLYGDGYQSLGLIETPAEDPTAPHELSCYATEDEWKHASRLRRLTIRIDGFVSVHARQKPGEFLSKPLTFSGKGLSLNFSTSAGGSIRVELQESDGRPVPGFSLADCDELFGDTLDRTVTWHGQSDLSALSDRPVRLRMALSDSDLYSLKFVK